MSWPRSEPTVVPSELRRFTTVEVHTEPADGGYTKTRVAGRGDSLRATLRDGSVVEVQASDLLP